MKFYEYVHLMHTYIGTDVDNQDFILYLTNLFLRDSITAEEDALDDKDLFNPLSSKDKSFALKIYNGTSNKKISRADARTLNSRLSKVKFLDEFMNVDVEAKENLIRKLECFGVNSTIDNVDEICAELYVKFLKALTSGNDYIDTSAQIYINSSGDHYHTIDTDDVYVENGKLHVGSETLQLPERLLPGKDIAPEEHPYINALCAAYADALEKAVSPDNISTLPGRYVRDYNSQRAAYYDADWLRHSVRDIIEDGENMFEELKEDAYQGIESTYLKDYENGFQRLQAVLEKITNTTLDTSTIERIKNLMKNSHKKGLCHMMVNDDVIKSWVNIDD